MNEESVGLISASPFVREFTYYVIRSLQDKKGIYPVPREVVHADLVPKISQKTMQASIMDKPLHKIEPVKKVIVQKPVIIQKPNPIKITPQRQILQTPKPIILPEISRRVQEPKPREVIDGYGKIDLLLNDPSVSVIECSGPGKPIVVIRVGQRQFTQIILNKAEIYDVLNEIANRAKIPLMEGVFRAAVDHFFINSIVSEVVGSKFVITKNPEYTIG